MERAILGNTVLEVVLDETMGHRYDKTSHPVESGMDITDHLKENPITLQISVVLGSKDSWLTLKEILDMQKAKEPVVYKGRNYMHNMLIVDIQHDRDGSNRYGANVSIMLEEANIVNAKRFDNNYINSQTAERSKVGRQQVRSA